MELVDENLNTKVLLQSDAEYYEIEKKRMVSKILSLSSQLDSVKVEASKYKHMWEDVKNKLKKTDSF